MVVDHTLFVTVTLGNSQLCCQPLGVMNSLSDRYPEWCWLTSPTFHAASPCVFTFSSKTIQYIIPWGVWWQKAHTSWHPSLCANIFSRKMRLGGSHEFLPYKSKLNILCLIRKKSMVIFLNRRKYILATRFFLRVWSNGSRGSPCWASLELWLWLLGPV